MLKLGKNVVKIIITRNTIFAVTNTRLFCARTYTQTTQIPPRLDWKLVGLVLSLKLQIPS